MVYIQTDKATYKPGDLVRYRVLFLDDQTRPAKLKNPVDIFINDAASNRIKQLKNVDLIHSVYTGEHQLSEFPALGDWDITVYENEKPVKTKKFEIAKYVLPKFDVKIESPTDISTDDDLHISIRSKYTFGKPVKGKASVSIKTSYFNCGASKAVDIDGKAFVEFNMKTDLQYCQRGQANYRLPLEILAVVEEELTGLKKNSTTIVKLHMRKFSVKGHNNPNTFVPGKPLKIQVLVMKYDRTPVIDEKNKVTLTAAATRYLQPYYATNTNIQAPQDLKFESSSINEHGIATFEITVPTNQTVSYYSLKATYLGIDEDIGFIYKTEIEKKRSINLALKVEPEKPKLGDEITLELSSDRPLEYLVYHVIAHGDIVISEHVQVPENRRSYTFKVTSTFAMVPSVNILVLSVKDGIMVFEEKTINFDREFINKVSN